MRHDRSLFSIDPMTPWIFLVIAPQSAWKEWYGRVELIDVPRARQTTLISTSLAAAMARTSTEEAVVCGHELWFESPEVDIRTMLLTDLVPQKSK